ncbi:MAG: protein kinase domain-containing protein [Pirellulaceae bacterium]
MGQHPEDPLSTESSESRNLGRLHAWMAAREFLLAGLPEPLRQHAAGILPHAPPEASLSEGRSTWTAEGFSAAHGAEANEGTAPKSEADKDPSTIDGGDANFSFDEDGVEKSIADGTAVSDKQDSVAAAFPAMVDRYQILSKIAEGGMGIILLGFDPLLGRRVAIKTLRPEFGNSSRRKQRFLQEAHLHAQLQHPSVVAVHESGELPDGRPYFVMSYIEGQTLSRLLRSRPDPKKDLNRFIQIFAKICQAIAYAHDRQIVHRDLKPQNVMAGDLGTVQVLDWGLAKRINPFPVKDSMPRIPEPTDPPSTVEDSDIDSEEAVSEWLVASSMVGSSNSNQLTLNGSVIGTVAYLSPEQARGDTLRIGKAADVFCLGGILCEILTGHPPYQGHDQKTVIRQARRGELQETHLLLKRCGAEKTLIDLTRRCLAFDPSSRPRDAGEVTEAITEYLESDLRRIERDQVRFFALSNDLFCVIGKDGYLRRFGPKLMEFTGLDSATLQSVPFHEHLHPEDRQEPWGGLVKMQNGQPAQRFRNRLRDPNGSYRWMEWVTLELPEENAYYAVGRDIHSSSAIAAMEEDRRFSQQRIDAMIESALDAVIMIDHHGDVVQFNPSAEAIFGYSRQEVLNKSLSDFIIPDRYREAHRRGMAHFLATGHGPVIGKRVEIQAMRKGGEEFDCELTITMQKLPSGPPVFTAYLRDLSNRLGGKS